MTIKFTEGEYAQFAQLVKMAGSLDQMDRIHSRLQMPRVIAQHGKAKCDAMMEEFERRNPRRARPRK
jgi:hypothetical protein